MRGLLLCRLSAVILKWWVHRVTGVWGRDVSGCLGMWQQRWLINAASCTLSTPQPSSASSPSSSDFGEGGAAREHSWANSEVTGCFSYRGHILKNSSWGEEGGGGVLPFRNRDLSGENAHQKASTKEEKICFVRASSAAWKWTQEFEGYQNTYESQVFAQMKVVRGQERTESYDWCGVCLSCNQTQELVALSS